MALDKRGLKPHPFKSDGCFNLTTSSGLPAMEKRADWFTWRIFQPAASRACAYFIGGDKGTSLGRGVVAGVPAEPDQAF
jgi:hypothetical protein